MSSLVQQLNTGKITKNYSNSFYIYFLFLNTLASSESIPATVDNFNNMPQKNGYHSMNEDKTNHSDKILS